MGFGSRKQAGESHTEVSDEQRGSPEATLDWLTPAIRTALGNLDGAPPAVADSVAQLLPFGSRAALKDLGIVTEGEIADIAGTRSIKLTEFGYQVIAAAARSNDAHPAVVRDWAQVGAQAAITSLSDS